MTYPFRIGLAAIILAVTGFAGWWLFTQQDLDMRPDMTLSLIDGTAMHLAETDGSPLLVVFWATTCAVCMHEVPDMIALHDELSGKGLRTVAIAMPYDPPNRVLDTARRFEIPYPIAIDIEGEAMRAFGDVKGTPATFLMASDGRVVYQQTGRTDFGKLHRKITHLLNGAKEET